MPGAFGQQQPPRAADAVGGEDHHVGVLLHPRARRAVDIDGAGGPPVRPGLDPLHLRAGPQLRPGRQRLGPQRDRHLRHRAARAAGGAVAAAVAGGAPVIAFGDNPGRHRPPMPIEPLEALRDGPAAGPHRQGAERTRRPRRQPGVAGRPAYAHQPVGLVVERRQLLVGDRPVRGEAVLPALAEVGRAEARTQRREHVGGAADAVPHQRVRLLALDRVVVRPAAEARLRTPAVLALVLEVAAVVRMLRRLGPPALVKADDPQPRLRQHQAADRAARPGADHQHVHGIGLSHRAVSRPSRLTSTGCTSPVATQRPRAWRGASVAASNGSAGSP